MLSSAPSATKFALAWIFLAPSASRGAVSLARATEPESCNVEFTARADDARGSMPLGNGDIGLNVWTEDNGDVPFWGGENPTTAEPRLRTVAMNTLAAYAARDSDSDGVSDADELGRYWDQPFDTDGDGIPDYLQTGAKPRAYDRWLQENFLRDYDKSLLAGPRQDPDSDGLPNLLEFALGADPLAPTRGAVTGALRPSTGEFGIEFTPNSAANDVAMEIQASEDLLSWTAVARSTTVGVFSPLLPGWSVGAGPAAGAVRVDGPPAAAGAGRFLRLRVDRATP